MMNDPNHNSEQLFTELFAHARPRARVSREHAQQMFDVLHDEWQHQLKIGRKRVWTHWAVAASLALMFIAGVTLFMQSHMRVSEAPVKVATLSRSVGDDLRLLDAAGEHLVGGQAQSGFNSGHRLQAGANTRAAIELQAGGTLRIDENTQIGFNADRSIRLLDGRVYFDSGYAPGTAPIYPLHERSFYLSTGFGEIHHLGTQFSVQTRPDHIVVSVREGEVAIVSETGRTAVSVGSRVIIDSSGVLLTQQIAPHDESWAWTQQIIPSPDFDQPRVAGFLSWVGRETGLQIRYKNSQARNIAETERSVGTVNQAPLQALEIRLQSVGLEYEIRDNQIIISVVP
ncbi:MAG: FecR domain-containing protein [Gammaproteobacteria bacterium]|nr:FecR domain-containing protein [Gammaproteobacteria bacterium]